MDTRLSQVSVGQLALIAGALYIAYSVICMLVLPWATEQGRFWRSAPWVEDKNKWFWQFRAGIASITSTKEITVEGYRKFGKKAFMLPQFSENPLLILSGQQLHDVLIRPDSDVDPTIPNEAMINTKRTIGDLDAYGNSEIIKRQLTRRLPLLTTEVYEELVLGMEKNWPATANSWTKVNIHPANMRIVSRAANRVFGGTELCRNEVFIEYARKYSVSVFASGAIYKLLPEIIHPVAAPFLNWPINRDLNVCRKFAGPIIDRRIAKLRDPNNKEPNEEDALMWIIEQSFDQAKTDPKALDRDVLIRRFLLLNMVAIHTTSMVISNVIMDLYTSPSRDDFVAGLREECERVLAEYGGTWTKDAVNKLYRIDSALRESLRHQVLGEVNIRRMVMNPNGISLSDGYHIPKGVTIVAPVHAIHTDESTYQNATEWNAFRFSQPREEYLARVAAGTMQSASKDDILQQKNQSLTAVSEDYLSFGHGKHACPGRFFASQELKLMLAHVILTYDIRIEGERPKNMSLNAASVPRDDVTMEIRLRT